MNNATCSVTDCESDVKSRGWCAAHYMRFLRTGSPTGSSRKSSLERLMPRVKQDDNGCWIWQGARMGNYMQYGQFSMHEIGRRTISAHRAAYLLLVGDIPDGLELDHLCRVTLCCNPKHLEPVTPEVNKARTKGTHCRRGHEYTPENTWLGGSVRRCRACDRIKSAKRQRRSMEAGA